MTCTSLVVTELKEKLNESQLTHAWNLCQLRHPNMRNKIVDGKVCKADSTGNPTFIQKGNVDQIFENLRLKVKNIFYCLPEQLYFKTHNTILKNGVRAVLVGYGC